MRVCVCVRRFWEYNKTSVLKNKDGGIVASRSIDYILDLLDLLFNV